MKYVKNMTLAIQLLTKQDRSDNAHMNWAKNVKYVQD